MRKYKMYRSKKSVGTDILLLMDHEGSGVVIYSDTKDFKHYLAEYMGGWDTSKFFKVEEDVTLKSISKNSDVIFRKNLEGGDLLIEANGRKVIVGMDRFGYYPQKEVKAMTLYNTIKHTRDATGRVSSGIRTMSYEIWSEPLEEITFKGNEKPKQRYKFATRTWGHTPVNG